MASTQAPALEGPSHRLTHPAGPELAFYDRPGLAAPACPIPPLVSAQVVRDGRHRRGRIPRYSLVLDALPQSADRERDTCVSEGPVGLWFSPDALADPSRLAIPRLVVASDPSGEEMHVPSVLASAAKLLGVPPDSRHRHRVIQVALYMLRLAEDEARFQHLAADHVRLLQFTPDDAYYRFASVLVEAACRAAGVGFFWSELAKKFDDWWQMQTSRGIGLPSGPFVHWRLGQADVIRNLLVAA